MNWYEALAASLQNDEGLSLKPYRDSKNVLTIGYGLNLEEGITRAEAVWLLKNRCLVAAQAARAVIPNFDSLSDVRKIAFANMAYNLGQTRLKGFHKMLAAVSIGDFKTASAEMMDSDAARELPARYGRLAAMVDKG